MSTLRSGVVERLSISAGAEFSEPFEYHKRAAITIFVAADDTEEYGIQVESGLAENDWVTVIDPAAAVGRRVEFDAEQLTSLYPCFGRARLVLDSAASAARVVAVHLKS